MMLVVSIPEARPLMDNSPEFPPPVFSNVDNGLVVVVEVVLVVAIVKNSSWLFYLHFLSGVQFEYLRFFLTDGERNTKI